MGTLNIAWYYPPQERSHRADSCSLFDVPLEGGMCAFFLTESSTQGLSVSWSVLYPLDILSLYLLYSLLI